MPKSKRHPARRPQQRTPRRTHPQGDSPRSRTSQARPPASSLRRRLEIRSAPVLMYINGLPRLVPAIALAAALVLGMVLPSRWAGLLVLLVGAFLGWLLALSWPLLSGSARAVRTLVVAAVVIVAALRLAGRF